MREKSEMGSQPNRKRGWLIAVLSIGAQVALAAVALAAPVVRRIPPPPSPPGREWPQCATEGGKCYVPSGTLVRYGVGASWVYGSAADGIACTNAAFSDAKPGFRKECYFIGPTPTGNWLRCAVEGGRCNFTGRATVRYGAGDAWVYGTASGGIACTNAAFSDPKPGTRKECYFVP